MYKSNLSNDKFKGHLKIFLTMDQNKKKSEKAGSYKYVDSINMADELSNGVKNLEISGTTENGPAKKGKNEELKALGFSTEELYKLALHFYRGIHY